MKKIRDNTLTADELRMFTPAALVALTKEQVTEITDFLAPREGMILVFIQRLDAARTANYDTSELQDVDTLNLDGEEKGTDDGKVRRLAHLDEYQHSNPVPLALFLMIFFIVGVVWLRFTRSVAEPKKRCRKATASDAKPRNSPELSC